jgi:hypothetical protein
MRTFYLVWFFVCSGWGYLIATGLDMAPPSIAHALAALPISFATGLGLLALEFSRLPKGRHLMQPTLALKPWSGYPIGLLVFISATFVLSSIWGVGLSVAVPLPGLPTSLQFLALGGGMLAALLLAPRLFPGRFAPSGSNVGQE